MTFTLGSHRVLAVCAHPDDESFGLGAVIAAFGVTGTSTRLLVFTRGEASTLGAAPELPSRRRAELSAAADALGIADVRASTIPTAASPRCPPVSSRTRSTERSATPI